MAWTLPLEAADVLRDVLRERREPEEALRVASRRVAERHRAGLHADAVGELGAGPARELEVQLRLRLEVAHELARAQQVLGVERMALAVAADAPAVVDDHRDVGIGVGARAPDLEQVRGRRTAAGDEHEREEGRERGPGHTTTSCASRTSRKKRGVESTPSSRSSTRRRSTP